MIGSPRGSRDFLASRMGPLSEGFVGMQGWEVAGFALWRKLDLDTGRQARRDHGRGNCVLAEPSSDLQETLSTRLYRLSRGKWSVTEFPEARLRTCSARQTYHHHRTAQHSIQSCYFRVSGADEKRLGRTHKATSSAISFPKKFSMKASIPSVPALTPAVVQTLPLSTHLLAANQCVFLPRGTVLDQAALLVVALWPSKTPARAASPAPVQTVKRY